MSGARRPLCKNASVAETKAWAESVNLGRVAEVLANREIDGETLHLVAAHGPASFVEYFMAIGVEAGPAGKMWGHLHEPNNQMAPPVAVGAHAPSQLHTSPTQPPCTSEPTNRASGRPATLALQEGERAATANVPPPAAAAPSKGKHRLTADGAAGLSRSGRVAPAASKTNIKIEVADRRRADSTQQQSQRQGSDSLECTSILHALTPSIN